MNKTKAVVVGLLCLGSIGVLHAWEMPGNPDRFPSIGVHIGSLSLSGSREEVDSVGGGILARDNGGDEALVDSKLGGDVRFPATEQITFELGGTYHHSTDDFNRVNGVYHENKDLHGYEVNLGVRFYLK